MERNEKIIALYKAGKTQVEIVATLGISRPTVSKVLKEAGVTNPQPKEAYHPSYIPEDVEILAKHRTHQTHKNLVAMDKDENEISIAQATRERMEQFGRGLKTKTWSYDSETEQGYYFVPRKPEHGLRPFIKKEELLGVYN